jgi:hypothetical protein
VGQPVARLGRDDRNVLLKSRVVYCMDPYRYTRLRRSGQRQGDHHGGVLGFTADRRTVFAVQGHVKHAGPELFGHLGLQLQAFAPTDAEVDTASQIISAATIADWAPISFAGQLHDRASYRYFWQVLERAHQTGRVLPPAMAAYFNTPAASSFIETL